MPESSTRVHGFQRPFDNHQLASWVALIIFLVLFYTLYLPLHTDAAGIVLGALYTATAAIVTYSAWKAMIIDPSDPSVAAKRLNSIAASSSAEGADTMWCYLCKVSVSRRSKHCRRCNKCVDVFDHHCPWLNTCIGAQNYRLFLVLLGSVFVLTCLQMGTAVHAAVAPYLEPAELERLRETYPHLPEAALAALLAVSCLLAFVTWLLITQLLLFHAGLLCRGLTTYEFIIAQRQKEKAEAAADEKRKPTRRTLFVRELQKQMPCLQMCRLCSEVERVERKPAGAANWAQAGALAGVQPRTGQARIQQHSLTVAYARRRADGKVSAQASEFRPPCSHSLLRLRRVLWTQGASPREARMVRLKEPRELVEECVGRLARAHARGGAVRHACPHGAQVRAGASESSTDAKTLNAQVLHAREVEADAPRLR